MSDRSLMTNDRQAGAPPDLNILFKGPWTPPEQERLTATLKTAEKQMTPSQRSALRGRWLARVSGRDQRPYFVLHRRGMGRALTGYGLDAIIEQIRSRWGR